MNKDVSKIKAIIDLLERVAEDQVSAEVALDRWPDIDQEENDLIAASWHDLSHFCNDDDIRKSDPIYDRDQRAVLKARAASLRDMFNVS